MNTTKQASQFIFTYQQHHSNILNPRFYILGQQCQEELTKENPYTIAGLISRSFIVTNEQQMNIIKTIFSKDCPIWIQNKSEFIQNTECFKTNSFKLSIISFGYLSSTNEYQWHQKISNSRELTCELNINTKDMTIEDKGNQLRLTQNCLDKYFIISNHSIKNPTIILTLKTPPRCYDALLRGPLRYSRNNRQLNFGTIDKFCLTNSSALSIKFYNQDELLECTKFLVNVLKLQCYRGCINFSQMIADRLPLDEVAADFWSSYAFQMILSIGYRIMDTISSETIKKINLLSNLSVDDIYPNHKCYQKLTSIYYRARSNKFFDINEEFEKTQSQPSSIILDKWVYVPRIILTPCNIYPLPVKPMRGNRILREEKLWGSGDHFCRVLIRDVDLEQPYMDFMKINEQWIKNLILTCDSIKVGNKLYKFLLCSNSQLRDKSFWFYASYQGYQVDDIHRWMGNFSHEKCIGTRIARMALSLTGTTATIKLQPYQIERIDDKEDGKGRCFTDGVGKISPQALRAALTVYNPELLKDNYMPSVIQARLNGMKGIFVLAPDLDNRGILIQYRSSQLKFTVEHNVLEIVKHSSAGMAFLNRQIIVLLENMGIKQNIFIKLQNKTRLKISMSLLADKTAQKTLEQQIRLYDWERMYSAGVHLTREPFSRSLLLLLAKDRLKRLKDKSHVPISLSDGRMLLGAVDETESLKPGQLFIQLRDLNGQSHIISNKKVLITKNPAHFPGDIRKLDAVDSPNLHHLYECVVFPAQGQRPHPNEISGSDLDGDEYWVCWNEELVNNAIYQYEPAEFDSVEKVKHDGDIGMKEIADFLFDYLSSDSLGQLSNMHLARCALEGPHHPDSLTLAKIISEAVDFPKTGVLPKCPGYLKMKSYPDFMENNHKASFESNSSVGLMYRQIKPIWEAHLERQKTSEDQNIKIDLNFIIPGYNRYVAEAQISYNYYSSKMNNILSTYDLQNEYELITGCHSGIEEEKKNNDSVETASLEFRELLREMRVIFSNGELHYTQKLCKASAWYYIAYQTGTLLSFGWIMDRFMSDIIERKQIIKEEHKTWKRIGQTLQTWNLDNFIKSLANKFSLEGGEFQDASNDEKLGAQFLALIDYLSQSTDEQDTMHGCLQLLHYLALYAT